MRKVARRLELNTLYDRIFKRRAERAEFKKEMAKILEERKALKAESKELDKKSKRLDDEINAKRGEVLRNGLMMNRLGQAKKELKKIAQESEEEIQKRRRWKKVSERLNSRDS
ncbi:MAG: hypothetical protein FWD15_04475 [Alphaproteobacteria bacterium]|nr:hypothetical protein [Alphaproteobacteria bacterium]